MIRFFCVMSAAFMVMACGSDHESQSAGTEISETADIYSQTWQWESTVTPVEKINVKYPDRYTVTFSEDKTVTMRFDCNRGSGNFTISENRLSFGPLMSTQAACPEDSLDAVFMKDLQQVASFFIKDGNLYLELPMDSGTMRFRSAEQDLSEDPLNAAYIIDGEEIRLRRGKAEKPAAPGSAAMIRTVVIGNPQYGDLNKDGIDDAVLFLQHSTGGSGTFYYAAAALFNGKGWIGTAAVFLGDRIIPDDIEIKDGLITIRYNGRRPEEPFGTPPEIEKRLELILDKNALKMMKTEQ